MFFKFSTLETSAHGLAEHVALQLAPKPHGDRWHQPCYLLQAALLVQRCLSAARGARHQAEAIALPLTSPLPPTLLSPAPASLQLPFVWGLGAATQKQSPEVPGQELLQAWLTAWSFTLRLIEYSYYCTKSCYIFVLKPRLWITQVKLAMLVSCEENTCRSFCIWWTWQPADS